MNKIILVMLFIGACAMKEKTADIRDLWDFSNLNKSRENFNAELTKHKENKEYVLELQTQIARTYGLESKFDEAHKLLEEVKSKITTKDQKALARYHIEKGRAYNSDKKKKEATTEFLKALDVSRKIKHEHLTVDSAHMLAIAATEFSEHKKWNELAIKEAKGAKDPKVKDWMGSLLNNWGWFLFGEKKYEEALVVFKDALKFRETKDNAKALAIAHWCVARTYRALNRVDEALVIQLDLIEQWKKIGKQDGYVFEELAELYLIKSDKEKAQKYFKLAHEELSKDTWFVKNESKRLTRLKELSL